jgi:hypothetical protein
MAQNIFRKCLILIVAFITASLCVHLNAEQKVKPVIKYFDVERFTPQDLYETNDDYFIRWPQQTQVDSKGNVYIADYEQDCIKVFTYDGKFIKRIGRSGEGPGEFRFINFMGHALSIDSNDLLYVFNNNLNPRIQVFDTEGNYLQNYKFNTMTTVSSMVVDSRGRIIYSKSCTPDSLNTIFILKNNSHGYKLEQSFAPQPFKNISKEEVEKLNINQFSNFVDKTSSIIALNEKDEIFQVFQIYPLIRKFSSDGTLIWSKTLNVQDIFSILDSKITRTSYGYEKIENLPYNKILESLDYTSQIFAYHMICIPQKKKLLIQLIGLSSILELDYDGNITALYCPKDLNNSEKNNSIPTSILSKLLPSAYYMSYNSKYNYILATQLTEYISRIRVM